MISLRPKQEDLYQRTRQSMINGHKSPLIVAPCGFGKTVLFSYFTRKVIEKNKRVMILAHRDELLDQISNTLNQFNVSHSFIAAGRFCSPRCLVHVASVFSLVKRLHKIPKPDVIIVDEAHNFCDGGTWSKIFNAYPEAWRIGVSASPCRLSGEPLGDAFDDLIIGPTTRELIDSGDLCEYRLFGAKNIDTSKIHTQMGDFNKKELNNAMDKSVITGNAVAEYTKYCAGKRAIVFCCSIKHAENVAEEFRKAGYSSGIIEGRMSKEARKKLVNDFREGRIQVLTSVNVISEGFDLPAIEVAIMLRPTRSLRLWIQQSGRALRNSPGKKEAFILDHAGNSERLQFWPCDTYDWSLEGRKKKEKEDDGIKIRLCSSCFGANESWRKVCKYCTKEFVVIGREPEKEEGDLHEVDIRTIRKNKRMEEGQCKTLEELEELAERRGYKRGWAIMRYKSRQHKKQDVW